MLDVSQAIHQLHSKRTSMQRARHFAAATSGGGVLVPDMNSNSNIDSGDVTQRRRCPAMSNAMSGKLMGNVNYKAEGACILYVLADQNSRRLQRSFSHQIITCRRLHAEQSFESILKALVQLA